MDNIIYQYGCWIFEFQRFREIRWKMTIQRCLKYFDLAVNIFSLGFAGLRWIFGQIQRNFEKSPAIFFLLDWSNPADGRFQRIFRNPAETERIPKLQRDQRTNTQAGNLSA
jgi:hypothetical protein